MNNTKPKTLCVFACKYCSLLGAERAAREHLSLPENIRLFPIACAGAVSPETVVQALINGAAGVAVLGCHLGGCRHNDVNRDAHARLSLCSSALEAMGIDPKRLCISWGAAHEAEGYAALMREFAEQTEHISDILSEPIFTVPPEEAGKNVSENKKLTKSFPPSQEEEISLREKASAAIKDGKAVLGLRKVLDQYVPSFFTSEEELKELTAAIKFPMAKIAGRYLRTKAGILPADAVESTLPLINDNNKPLAVVCRECDVRALKEQIKLRRFPLDSMEIIPISCSEEQKNCCSCLYDKIETPADQSTKPDFKENALFWKDWLTRCVQCHWCRMACPICICPECSVENNPFLPSGSLPPSPLGYHLIRALHVADSCVGCGACQDACPQGLPLLTLHKALISSLGKNNTAGTDRVTPLRTARLSAGILPPLWIKGLQNKGEK